MTRNPKSIHTDEPVTDKEEHTTRRNNSPTFQSILQARLSRRDTLRGGLGVAATTLFAGAGLSACGGDDGDEGNNGDGGGQPTANLSFDSVAGVAGSEIESITLPEGYTYDVLIPWGTGILGSFPEFKPDGSNTAAEQEQQSGEWHDGMTFFPRQGADNQGLLCVNHESLHLGFFHGVTNGDSNRETDEGGPTNINQVRKEIAGHGVSIVEIRQMPEGKWAVMQSGFNRRITADTRMRLTGPAAGSEFLVTAFSTDGTLARGTINNCARGYTPWNTYLTCEENFQGYVTTQEDPVPERKTRYGLSAGGYGYLWSNLAGHPEENNREFERWDTTPTGDGPANDFRNEANTFGWVVEIDPFDPASIPRKRTAMGRMRHEGCQSGLVEAGKQIAFYMGDDDEFEYIYKFVTADAYDPDNPDPNMLDRGTLYVARLREDGTGEWLPLDTSNPDLSGFSSQAEILTFARLAADAAGATPMDRPEWSTTDPNTGEIYFTLTNNEDRSEATEPNPRAPNNFGHVIRHREDGDDPAATTFTWEIFVFGAPANADASINLSGLTEDNQFAGPDGLWFDPRGVLWIETDNGGNAVADATNDQLLAVIPSQLGGDRTITPDNQASLRRFLVGPGACEVTGIELAPDARTLFVNIQHPGQSFGQDAPLNAFPDGGNSLPRSTTLAIRRTDGGEIAL